MAPASFRPLVPFIAIDVVAEARAFGPVRTFRSLAANGALPRLEPLLLAADVALRAAETVGLDSNRAARYGVDDLDVAVFAVEAVAICARR